MAANDYDSDCEATYRGSHPETVFIPGRIEELNAESLLEVTGLEPGQVDCIAGGPPCQAFSIYNHQRGMQDKRSGLFREFLRIVKGLRPVSVVLENVPGILSVANGRAVREICESLGELGYRVHQKVLKAEAFGVPQERRRIFLVGLKSHTSFAFPAPSHGKTAPLVTVAEASHFPTALGFAVPESNNIGKWGMRYHPSLQELSQPRYGSTSNPSIESRGRLPSCIGGDPDSDSPLMVDLDDSALLPKATRDPLGLIGCLKALP